MSDIYLLKNQDQAYLDKSNLWINSGDRRQLYRTPHKDEAVNMRVEWAVKHPELRIEITKAQLDERGLPLVDLPRSPKVPANTEIDWQEAEQVLQAPATAASSESDTAQPGPVATRDTELAPLTPSYSDSEALSEHAHDDNCPPNHENKEPEVSSSAPTPEFYHA